MKLDALVENVIFIKKAKAKAMGRKFKLRRPPRISPPVGPQRAYLAELRRYIAGLKEVTARVISPVVSVIVEQAQQARPKADSARADDFVDMIQGAFDLARVQFYRKYTDAEILGLATRAVARTADFNLDQLNKVFGAVLEVKIPGNEPWLRQEIKAFTKENVSLIKSIPDQYFSRIERQVTQAAQRGVLGSDLASEIARSYDVTESRAAVIARDQVSKFNSDLNRIRQQAVGVQKYRWSTSNDERVRPSHEEKEGEVFSWDDPPADTGHPGEDIQCRCVPIPIFDPKEEAEE